MAVISPNFLRRQKFLRGLGLACILASFVIAVVRLHPTALFGQTEDDSIYLSSAKALAEGRGYILASFPGTPAATKYPVFYPWILSWVWRWNPSFPANLPDAIAVSTAFGVLYITACFLFLRRFGAIGDVEALILTAFCALNPVVVLYGGSVLSEIPFAALALAAMLLAEKATQPTARPVLAVCCGALVGICMVTRAFGVPLAAGIALAALVHRAWRQLTVFCGSAAPFFAALCWKIISAQRAVPPVSGEAAASLGWIHTWSYYTSYLNDWKEGVPTAAIFFTMLKNNFLGLIAAPAAYFLSPLVEPQTIPKTAAVILVAAAAVTGIFRKGRDNQFRPIHFVLPFYACLIVVWIYSDAIRFLIPFLPLLAVGIWLEGRRLLTAARTAIAGRGPAGERILAIAFSILIVAFTAAVIVNYFGRARTITTDLSRQRASLLEEKREAYAWVSRSTAPDARVVAYEDASLYLYTGRAATRPFIFKAAEFYDPPLLERDLDHITDVARAIGAQYWLASDDDFGFEWQDAYTKAHARMRALEQILPIVFRSRRGTVRVYFLGCFQDPGLASCRSASDAALSGNNQ